MSKRTIALLGSPGSGKSLCGLSWPGVEQHVFGSSEETTAENFPERQKSGDILAPVKFDWYDTLSDVEKAMFTDESVSELKVAELTRTARARNIIKYRRYLYGLKKSVPENLKTIFLDNGTPFAQDFEDYVRVVYGAEFATKEGNFNTIAFAIKYGNEIIDFLRMLTALPVNVIISFHISMAVDEATAATANFMQDTAKGVKHKKEWQPLIMGKAKYQLAGLFDYAFYLWCEENPGQPNKYLAKLEADDTSVGVSKCRVQPFGNPRAIRFPKNEMYSYLESAVKVYKETGKPFQN